MSKNWARDFVTNGGESIQATGRARVPCLEGWHANVYEGYTGIRYWHMYSNLFYYYVHSHKHSIVSSIRMPSCI